MGCWRQRDKSWPLIDAGNSWQANNSLTLPKAEQHLFSELLTGYIAGTTEPCWSPKMVGLPERFNHRDQ